MSKRLYSSLEQEDLKFIKPSNLINKKRKKVRLKKKLNMICPIPKCLN